MVTLYDYELSGNCYKIRLFLNILDIAYERREIEFFPGKEHKSESMLALNPLGQLPVLDDDGFIMRDAQAILTYLARHYAPDSTWYPVNDAKLLAQINMWLAFANELTATSSAARLHEVFGYELDVEQARHGAYQLFQTLDEHLWFSERRAHGWVAQSPHPTVADIACFPYVILADEGGISLVDFPALRRWTDKVKRIPGFVVMAGVFGTAPGCTCAA